MSGVKLSNISNKLLLYGSPTLRQRLKAEEGLRLKPYRCTSNRLTIGYGHNLDSGITEEAAEILLSMDIAHCTVDMIIIFGNFLSKISVKRQEVLLNMRFNLGSTGFLSFKKMIAAIKAEDFDLAAKEMIDSKWYTQVNKRAELLVTEMIKG